MKQIQLLSELLQKGFHRIGQIEILHSQHLPLPSPTPVSYILCHQDDRDAVIHHNGHPADFLLEKNPFNGRVISTYSDDGSYRFTKGETNLRHNWVMWLENDEQLHHALEAFYPASFSLYAAEKNGTLDSQHLRDKLNRQTGMYRFARSISDAGAQKLIIQICGPAHQCAKKILWQLDSQTPLEPSEASNFNGISSGLNEPHAIPLLCREACNHFVAECRLAAKKEFEAKA